MLQTRQRNGSRRDAGRFSPLEWARFRDAVPESERAGNLVDAYSRLLHQPNRAVREQAARGSPLDIPQNIHTDRLAAGHG